MHDCAAEGCEGFALEVHQERVAQGLPPFITDEGEAAWLADLIGDVEPEPRCPACLRGQHDICSEALADGSPCQCSTCPQKDDDPERELEAVGESGRPTTAIGA